MLFPGLRMKTGPGFAKEGEDLFYKGWRDGTREWL